jgi:hypothetical protein
MKKITYLFALIFLTLSCGVKTTRTLLTSGDYDAAIRKSAESLRSNKNAKGNQDYVYLLEEAYAKATERDLRNIDVWSKDSNPDNLEKIFDTYNLLSNRQELIRPLEPLKLISEGRDAKFPMEDYSDEIIASKNKLVDYIYTATKKLLATNDKLNFRKAYEDLLYIKKLNANYKDVASLIDLALQKGTDYIFVYTKNETNMVIPTQLQNDLLDFGTFGLNDRWTVYHSTKAQGIVYDYSIMVNFRTIIISPEQVKEKEFIKEKQVKDGVKNLLDTNGNVVKDNAGNPIKVDNMITVKAQIYEFKQFKSVQITAKVDYIQNNNNQLIATFPLASEYAFDYIYAHFNGDKRACEDNYLTYFSRKSVPFPSNEQMIFDSGEDLKAKLKDIINKNKFRR